MSKPWELRNHYAGIGSRETPEPILQMMMSIAKNLGDIGWVLRTGGAPGADTAFLTGANLAGAHHELYLPWNGFNNYKYGYYNLSEMAMRIAAKHHPNWSACSSAAQKLHTRNVYQVLGKDCLTKSEFVLCWTSDGSIGGSTSPKTGGTGQALRIAWANNVPVYNLQRDDHRALWQEFLDDST